VLLVALRDSGRLWDLFRPGLHAGVGLPALSLRQEISRPRCDCRDDFGRIERLLLLRSRVYTIRVRPPQRAARPPVADAYRRPSMNKGLTTWLRELHWMLS
jgi:hypothetical protein